MWSLLIPSPAHCFRLVAQSSFSFPPAVVFLSPSPLLSWQQKGFQLDFRKDFPILPLRSILGNL